MRFYYSLTLSALILLYLISDNVLEASKKGKGRYVFVKCRPDSKNANCITKKGPRIDLHGKPHKISSRSINDIYPVESSEESYETEESGDGSGDFNFPDLSRKQRDSGAEEEIQTVMEGSADYNNYISPSLEKLRLSAEDLREDNMIE
ncbi:hypothetical protein QTP70_019133 [Hemibagrus guttatus]|uniref:Serglycin n=1 Tax=Hemibagrus guttatus TaxID=175788 RepID=A0AAE0RH88_9TELE|nr:hypothetical protein QTP70_019133 [Hemibagrus guttatus]KAK3573409.1 hypothetical protein QTP86_024702 [Hemibagrus guttatus]